MSPVQMIIAEKLKLSIQCRLVILFHNVYVY